MKNGANLHTAPLVVPAELHAGSEFQVRGAGRTWRCWTVQAARRAKTDSPSFVKSVLPATTSH